MKVNLIIPRDVYVKTMWWIDHSDKEISGFGKIQVNKEKGEILVLDSFLFPQENGPAETDIKAEDMALGIARVLDKPGDLRWWWHSHVNMGVFWSGVDMANMRTLGAKGWFLSTVFNKKRESKSAYMAGAGKTIVTPWGTTTEELFIDDVPTTIMDYADQSVFDAFKAEYDANVKERSYASSYPMTAMDGAITTGNGKTSATGTGGAVSKKMQKRLRKLQRGRPTKMSDPNVDRFDEEQLQRLEVCSIRPGDITVLEWLEELDTEEIVHMVEKGYTVEQICGINYATGEHGARWYR